MAQFAAWAMIVCGTGMTKPMTQQTYHDFFDMTSIVLTTDRRYTFSSKSKCNNVNLD
jgi:hypothetical protein